MTRRRVPRPGLWLFVPLALLWCALPTQAQERHLVGEIFTGYSSVDLNSNTTSSLYAGFQADLSGYWKHPKILTYDFRPNLSTGFQYAGPLVGPSGRGLSVSSTFLGGSRIPLFVYFSRQTIPTPSLTTEGGSDTLPGLSRTQQTFGLDWTANLKRWPMFEVHYFQNKSVMDFPARFGGDTDSHGRDFRVATQYDIWDWKLSGGYSLANSEAQNLFIVDPKGQPELDHTGDRDLSFAASRKLPFRSQLVIDAGARKTSINVGDSGTFSSYTRGSGTLTSQLTDRLSGNLNTSYLSSFSDYARQQVLQPGGSNNVPPGTTLLAIDSAFLSFGGGLQYRISKSLTAHGNYYSTQFLSDSAHNGPSGDGRTAGGGLSFYRNIWGGRLTTSYDYSDSNTEAVTKFHSTQQSVSAGYARPLVWGLKFSSMGTITDNHIRSTYTDSVTNYLAHVELSRHQSSGWDVRARIDFRKQTHFYPVRNEFMATSFQLMVASKKLQAVFTQRLDSGLAFRFGSGVIPAPNPTQFGNLNGLPPLVDTYGSGTSISAVYRLMRRLSVRGGWLRSTRKIDGSDALSQRALDVHAEYAFRRLRFATGYTRNWNQIVRGAANDFHTRTLYFEIKRDFQLF